MRRIFKAAAQVLSKIQIPVVTLTIGTGLQFRLGTRFRLDVREMSSLQEWTSIGTGCLRQWWNHHP